MKELLLNPLTLTLLLINGIVFFLLLLKYVFGKDGNSKFFERCFAFSLFLIIAEMQIFPFYRLHPSILAETENLLTWLVQAVLYLTIFLLMKNSFHHVLKGIVFLFKDIFIGVLILLLVLCAVWSDVPGITFQKSMAVIIVTTIAAYIGYRYTWKELSAFIRWSTTIVAAFSIIAATILPSISILSGRWNGVLKHPLDLGSLMSLGAAFWCAHAIYEPGQRKLSFGFAAISLFVLAKAASGGGLGTFAVLLILLLLGGIIKRLSLPIASIAITFFSMFGVLITSSISEIINVVVVGFLGKDLTLTGRTDFWPQLIDRIGDRPWLGYGYYGFWQEGRNLSNPSLGIMTSGRYIPHHAHNGFLDLALALGLVGLTLFTLSYLRSTLLAIRYLIRSELPESVMPILILFYILLSNISNSFLLAPRFSWFCFILLIVRLNVDLRRDSKDLMHVA